MGNDASQLGGLDVDERAIEVADFWGHYRATVGESSPLFNLKGHGSISVFKSESAFSGPPWEGRSPLEECANNLMKYRHPCMMRYIWHWQHRGVRCLATEPVLPLSQVLSSQDSLQVCVGLHRIAQALDFLHGKARRSHNNVGAGSVYVMSDGCWILGGVEFLRSFSETTPAYLGQIRKYRCDRGVDRNEETSDDLAKTDQFAFGRLAEDVLEGRSDDDVPHAEAFRQFCIRECQNPIASLRPSFSALLEHEFFNHEFLSIHKFLLSLPVKTEREKEVFFSNLLEKLRKFNEETVARQLGGPLLSRLVLLNPTARELLLPHILTPKDANSTDDRGGLFSLNVFKNRVTPQLLKMFRVRDTQVRLLLLKHFSNFMITFCEEDLTAHILPELLLGIKDTDDELVSMTLYCLADLVPVLGASTVIGAKRTKLFTDGRPMGHLKPENKINLKKLKKKNLTSDIEVRVPDVDERFYVLNANVDTSTAKPSVPIDAGLAQKENSFGSKESIEIENHLFLHERPSPDGGEDLGDEIVQNIISDNLEASDENWSDWEENENKDPAPSIDDLASRDRALQSDDLVSKTSEGEGRLAATLGGNIIADSVNVENTIRDKYQKNDIDFLQKAAIDAKSKKLTDISELDIKNQKYIASKSSGSSQKDEFDFFTDMEPVIEKANVLNINERVKIDRSKFALDMLDSQKILESDKLISAKLSFTPVENDQIKVDRSAWGDVDWEDD